MVLGLIARLLARARTEGSFSPSPDHAGDHQAAQAVPHLLIDGPGVPIVQIQHKLPPFPALPPELYESC